MSQVNLTASQIEQGVRPYKVYTALLTQWGTDAPVATVLENTLGGDVLWSYVTVGIYRGSLINAFPFGKTYCNGALAEIGGDVYLFNIFCPASNGDDYIQIGTWDIGITGTDGWAMYVEIRVYP